MLLFTGAMTSNIGGDINTSFNVGVLTISDRCYQGVAEDTSGPNLVAAVKSLLPPRFKVNIVNINHARNYSMITKSS